ncbi:MAG: hypothetical protein GWO04_45175 [Actinobacteria bacterium]|nr:hypothetical protein [Actinomycetota bacterium]
MRNPLVLTLIAGLAAACAARPDLEPAPGAQPAPPGPGKGAMATSNGVTVIARSDAWTGFPERLEEVTPVQVTIENGSGAPIRLRYSRFALVAPTGETYAAIPPFDVRGEEVEPIDRYVDGFYVAPHLRGYYPGLPAYRGYYPAVYDYYDVYYPRFLEIELPTGDMIQKALPEGVLMPGGRITGFLYFENVDRDVPTVDFTMLLVESVDGDGAPFGTVRIPFRVE